MAVRRRAEAEGNSAIDLTSDRPIQRRRLSEEDGQSGLVDLAQDLLLDDDDYMSDNTLARNLSRLFPSTKSKRRGATPRSSIPKPPPEPKEVTHDLELQTLPFRNSILVPNKKTVELESGEFLRIKKILNQLTVTTATGEISSSKIFLKGTLFARTKKLNAALHFKFNEVALVEEDFEVILEDVKCVRQLRMTNAPYPQFRDWGEADESWLICRWIWNLQKYEGQIRRVTEAEADGKYRTQDETLRYHWRDHMLKEVTKDLSPRHEKPIHEQPLDEPGPVQLNITDPGFEPDPVSLSAKKSGKLPIVVLDDPQHDSDEFRIDTEMPPRAPLEKVTKDFEADSFKGTRYCHGQECNLLKPHLNSSTVTEIGTCSSNGSKPYQTPHRSEEVERVKGLPVRSTAIVTIDSEEDEEDVPLLKKHREAFFTIPVRVLEKNDASGRPLVKDKVLSTPTTPTRKDRMPLQTSYTFPVDDIRGLLPESHPRPNLFAEKYTFGDAFCGGGGSSCAARMSGFKVCWGFDKNEAAIKTWAKNYPTAKAFHCSVHEFNLLEKEDALVDVLHLSPPCQPFSPAHTIQGKHDADNQAALLCVTECLLKCKPRFATAEQTTGILDHREYFLKLLNMFTETGFSVAYKVLKGVEYGLPQNRKRLFIIAAAPGEILPSWPEPTHSLEPSPAPPFLPPMSLNSAINSIPVDATEHEPRPFARPRALPYNNPDTYLNRTIMAGGGDYDVHPSGLRPFTLRELACIQGFPMDYQFVGNWGEKKRQVGNAVPPVFGAAVMMEVRKTMERCDLEREEQRKRAEERREEEEEEGKDEGKEEEGGEQVRQLEDEIQVYEI